MREVQSTAKPFILQAFSIFQLNIFILGMSFVSSIITSRGLGPELKGVLTALFVVPNMLLALLSSGLRSASIVHLGRREWPEETIIRNISFTIICTAAAAAAALLGASYLLPDYQQHSSLLPLLVISLVFQLVVFYAMAALLGRGQIDALRSAGALPHAFYCTFLVLSLSAGALTLHRAVAAHAAAQFLSALFVLHLFRKQGFSLKPAFTPALLIELLKLGVSFSVALFVLELNMRLDILLLRWLSTPAEVGIYSVGVNIAELIWQVPSAVGTIVLAGSSSAPDASAYSLKVGRAARLTVLAATGCAVFLWAAGDTVLPLLYGKAFAASSTSMKLLLPGILCVALFKVLNMDLAGQGRPLIALSAWIPGLLINVGANLILIPRLGAQGAALASSVSYAFSTAVFVVLYRRAIGLSWRAVACFNRDDWALIGRCLQSLRLTSRKAQA